MAGKLIATDVYINKDGESIGHGIRVKPFGYDLSWTWRFFKQDWNYGGWGSLTLLKYDAEKIFGPGKYTYSYSYKAKE